MNKVYSLKFDDMFSHVIKLWPETVNLETSHERKKKISEIYKTEDTISSELIGSEYELLYRLLSVTILNCIQSYSDELFSISPKALRADYVKSKFNERLGMWKSEDNGITADIDAREKYFALNEME